MSPALKSVYAALAFALFVPAVPAAEVLTEDQKASILKRLDDLLQRRESGATSGSTVAMNRLRSAAASNSAAATFYIACVKLERFERDEKKASEFIQWKSNHATAFRSELVGKCLRAHALGLLAAIQTANADKLKPEAKDAQFLKNLPDILTFADLGNNCIAEEAALANEDKKDKDERDIMGQAKAIIDMDIFNSAIAKTLNISAYIKTPEGFPTKISEVNNITESFILPRLYEIGELAPIDETWTRHITRLASAVTFYKDEKLIAKSKDIFEEQLPLARWAQARDRFTYGDDKVAGATAMLDVIKNHLDNEFAVTWIEEFEQLVNDDTVVAESVEEEA